MEVAIALVVIGLIVAGILLQPILSRQRRDRIRHRAFPPLWNALVENYLPPYTHLSPEERRRLQGHIQVFLAEKQFIGCAGLQVTEEMRVTIAAIACFLLLNERGSYFSRLRSILIYPSTYRATETVSDGYFVSERQVARLGESWTNDQVVLSWEQITYDVRHWQDGRNLVLHEFAHQLDQEDGKSEGVPVLPQPSDYVHWAKVMTEAYQHLCHDVQQGNPTVMDSYGATNPAEFFAVATETFFEKPHSLQSQHPDLFEQLQLYYRLDPRQWV
jgi:Mlc titration factor MtfA (ptsG expression regulator)